MKKTIVVDAFSLIYKAHFAVREMNTSDGVPTNAIYGFMNMLLKIIKDEAPDHFFVAFDCGKTFRHEAYDLYKANRAAMPDALKEQLPYIHELLDKANVASLSCEGFEADDVVGLVSKKAEKRGELALVVTGDRDSFQLVSDRINIIYAKKGVSDTVRVDPDYIKEKYGLTPHQLIDVKALMGDASDNIPGISGIGEKTALSLITTYGTLESIYENIELIKGKLKEKLETGKKSALNSRMLAEIKTEFACEPEFEHSGSFDFSNEEVINLLNRLEMKNLVRQLGGNIGQTAQTEKFTNDIIHELPSASFFDGKKVAVALEQIEGKTGAVLCVACDNKTYIAQANNDYLEEIFCTGKAEIFTHRLKEQYKLIRESGIKREIAVKMDIFIAAYLIDALAERYDASSLARKYLGLTLPERVSVKQVSFFDDNTDSDLSALADKTRAVYLLIDIISQRLKELDMQGLYENIEHKLIFILAEMELNGFCVDKQVLNVLNENFDSQMGAIVRRIRSLSGNNESLNINSTKQLAWLLYEDLGLPVVKKTKKGLSYSTDNETLEKLRDKHEIVPLIIEYRQVSKLSSTYVKGMMNLTDEQGRIHSSFNQTITTTGRISSSNPNLQNIPVRTQEGREIRKAFIASPGCVLVDADYSQIELRVLSHIANDENMLEAFKQGEDIHRRTASEVFGVKPEEVTSLMRSRAKAVNFGIVYGISDYGLSKSIGVKRQEAKEYIDKYLERFSGVRDYMSHIVKECERDGYVSTLFGRRRYIPEINSSNFNLRSFAQRTALNTPIQGTAADIIKIAMVNVSSALSSYKAKLILQVHDELIIDCPEEETEKVKELLVREMENAAKLNVALKVDINCAKSWFDAK